MGEYVKVKGLGCVPVEAFPKGYRVRTKDGKRLSPSQIPQHMIINMKDETRQQIINLMKQRGLKLIDETQKIGGRTFLVKRELNGNVTKTDINALPKYADLPPIQREMRKLGYGNAPQGNGRTYNPEAYPFGRASTVAGSAYTPGYAYFTRTGPVDKYKSFKELEVAERRDVDYRIEFNKTGSNVLVLAVHGGGTEPGTTELASAIADKDLNYYSLVSLKGNDTTELHITSTRFDEPVAVEMVTDAYFVLSLHGAGDKDDTVYLGGRNTAWGAQIKTALEARGFTVKVHTNANLAGTTGTNIANRGITGQGVQLELGRGLRRKMFEGGMTDRQYPTDLFFNFVAAIRLTVPELSDDPTDRVIELLTHIEKAKAAIDEAISDVLDLHEEFVPKLSKILGLTSDEEVETIYEGLSSEDTAFIDKLPESDKAKLKKVENVLLLERARLERVTKKIEKIIAYHVRKQDEELLTNLRDLAVGILPSVVSMIDDRLNVVS
jgi:phage replication-related protein YjqB (UPF0714/DUF867 family)